MDMASGTTIKPSFSIRVNTVTTNDTKFNETNRTLLTSIRNSTNNLIGSSSSPFIGKGNSSNSTTGVENLFMWVFIASVALALLLIISLFMVIVFWSIRRRRRTATVTDISKGADKVKQRKRGRVNLRHSIKRVFESDGPLYAVSNLNASRYTGITERQRNPKSDSNRSSMEIIISPTTADNLNEIPKNKQNIVYQHYLSPVEGVPSTERSESPDRDRDDETYLKPIDELRASKRFLQQISKEEPEDAYLEPLHGIPVPDDVQPKTSTPKPGSKPCPSPKPPVKPKP